jgi:hypothetical protein
MLELLAQMSDQEKLVRAGLLFAGVAVLIGFGAFIVSRFRDREDDDQPQASELLTNFRELHEEGELSDQEFRKIKTLLADQLERELSSSGKQDKSVQRDAGAGSGESVRAD